MTTETRLMGMADGSVVTQALVDGVWVTADPMAELSAMISEAPGKAVFPPLPMLDTKPRRGRAPK
jgi:hypothetical protein